MAECGRVRAQEVVAFMEDHEMQPATGDWVSLKLIRYYLAGYGTFAGGLSALSLFITVSYLSDRGALAAAGFFGVMGVYGVVASLSLFLSWSRLRRRTPDAPHATRIALLTAIPGSAFVGLLAFLLRSGGGWVSGVAWAVVVACAANVVALLRLYFTDLDALLWEEHSRGMEDDELGNFMEEEVELDLAAATDSVAENEDAPAVVEVK